MPPKNTNTKMYEYQKEGSIIPENAAMQSVWISNVRPIKRG
jgi:hypothetical protein